MCCTQVTTWSRVSNTPCLGAVDSRLDSDCPILDGVAIDGLVQYVAQAAAADITLGVSAPVVAR